MQRLFSTTSTLAFYWPPALPRVGRGSADGVLSHFRLSMLRMILYSQLTIYDVADALRTTPKAVRTGIASSRASIKWMGLIAYATKHEVRIGLSERTAWS